MPLAEADTEISLRIDLGRAPSGPGERRLVPTRNRHLRRRGTDGRDRPLATATNRSTCSALTGLSTLTAQASEAVARAICSAETEQPEAYRIEVNRHHQPEL